MVCIHRQFMLLPGCALINAVSVGGFVLGNVGCYPFIDRDPFILEATPHVYFAGNQSVASQRKIKGRFRLFSFSQIPSIDWLIDCFVYWSVDWLIDWFVCWLVDWLIDLLIDWFFCLLIDWLIGWLIMKLRLEKKDTKFSFEKSRRSSFFIYNFRRVFFFTYFRPRRTRSSAHCNSRLFEGSHTDAGELAQFGRGKNIVQGSDEIKMKYKAKRLSWDTVPDSRHSTWVETVPESKQWQAAWAKRALERKPQAKFAPADSPWERPCSNSATLLCTMFFPPLLCWFSIFRPYIVRGL